MNGQALVDRCEVRFGDPSNNVVAEAEWLAYLNDAYLDVVAADPLWPFLEGQTTNLTVTAGAGTVALPSDVWRVTSVYNATDKWPLTPIPGRSEYRHWFPDPASNLGTPQWYRLRGATLEVYPWAAAATTLHADIAAPPAEITTSTEPVFPEQYHRILIHGALIKAYEDDGNLALAATHQARYERLLAAMRTDLLGPRTEGYPEVVDTWG